MTWTIRTVGTPGERARSVRFQSLRVRRSIEEPVSEAQFALIDERDLTGRLFEVYDRDILRFRGVVEQNGGIDHRGYTATARSLTAALAVWDNDSNELFRKNSGESARTHADILQSIASNVGLTVAQPAVSRSISRFRIKRGETLLSAAQRLAAAGTWVLTDTPAGQLRMFDYTGQSPVDSWQPGYTPVLELENQTRSIVDWRDTIIVRGQRIAVSADDGASADDAQISDEFSATTVANRPSQLVIPNSAATSRVDAIQLALWEATKRTGKSQSVTGSLSSWAEEPGSVVFLRDPRNDINGQFIVQSMEVSITESSERYSTRLVSPLVYDSRARRAVLPGVAA